MGTATFWHLFLPIVIPVAYLGLLVALVISLSRVAARNAPTLRSRRFQIYSIFWTLQYTVLIIIVSICILTATVDWLFPEWRNRHNVITFFLIVLLPQFFLLSGVISQSDPKQRLKRIVENDLGLPSQQIESYTYPQVERRFLLSLLTNLLLAIMLHVSFVGNVIIFSNDVAALSFLFLAQIIGGMVVIALVTVFYYLFGRSLLELCRTKQNFLSTPPLIENSLEVILMKKCQHPIADIREAVARFDPITMTEDEPEVAARPFPRHWLWIGGFYAVFIVGMFCLAVVSPNTYAPREILKQTGIIHNYTVPGDFVLWNPERYYRRGIRESHENPQKAIEDFSFAIRLNPRYAEAYARRAHCWLHLGHEAANAEKAIADMSEAIRLDEPRKGYYISRAMMYEELGEPEKAAADWKSAGHPK